MLFLELLPIDCLNLPSWTLNSLKGSRFHTVRAAKQFRQDSYHVMREYWYQIDEDLHDALYHWRCHNVDLGVVSIPNDAVASLPPLTVINFINERTIIQNYTVRFQVPRVGIVDDLELSKFNRLPKALYELVKDAGCRTIRDVITAPFELFEDTSGDDSRLLIQLVEWFRKKCVVEFEPGLKPPFTQIDAPEDIYPLVRVLYDDINIGALVIDYEDIIASLLPFRSYVADKLKHTFFFSPLLDDNDLMDKVYAQPSFIEAAAKLVGISIESHKWMGVTRQVIDSELPRSVHTAGGAAPFLRLLLERGSIAEQFRAFFPVYRSDDGDPNAGNYNGSNYSSNTSNSGNSNDGDPNDGIPSAANETSPADDPKQLLYDQIRAALKAGKRVKEVMREFGVLEATVRRVIEENYKRSKLRPPLPEDRYRYWFSKYKMTKEEFCFIFGVDEEIYKNLRRNSRKGEQDFREMEMDERATVEVVDRLWQLLRKRRKAAEA